MQGVMHSERGAHHLGTCLLLAGGHKKETTCIQGICNLRLHAWAAREMGFLSYAGPAFPHAVACRTPATTYACGLYGKGGGASYLHPCSYPHNLAITVAT